VGAFFTRAGFRVEMNPRAAVPRQTDANAQDDTIRILIEAKAQKRNVTIADVEDLRSRLNRTPHDVVGALFTTAGISDRAVQSIEQEHVREILVFVGPEIEQLRSGRQNMRVLIDHKREALNLHGKVVLNTRPNSKYLTVKLPRSDMEFRIGAAAGSYFESRSRFSGASFVLHMPDAGWGTLGGEGARLSLQPVVSTLQDLKDLMGYLHEIFGLSKNGAFFIHQTESCWHGTGAQNFLEAVADWRGRYAASPAKAYHHSEEFSYFDDFGGGWLQLSAQQRIDAERAGPQSLLYHVDLALQLPGIPLDTARYLKLCRYVGNDWAHFDVISQRFTAKRRLKKDIRLQIVGRVIQPDRSGNDDERTVVGVIARNPFYGKKTLPEEFNDPDLPPCHGLAENALLLCSLRDWHDEAKTADYYELEGIEVTEGGNGPIFRPFGTWNKLRPAPGRVRKRRTR
jgi:hypothetical protein